MKLQYEARAQGQATKTNTLKLSLDEMRAKTDMGAERIRILMQTCMELSLSIWMWGRMGIVMEFYSWIAMAWMCFTMGIRWHIKWSEVSLTSISSQDHHHLRLWSSILDLLAGQHPCHTGLSVGPSVFFKDSESLCCHLHFQGKCYCFFHQYNLVVSVSLIARGNVTIFTPHIVGKKTSM